MQLEFLLAPIITSTTDIKKDKCDRMGAVKIHEKKTFLNQSIDINLCCVYLRVLQIVVLMYIYFTDIS